MYVTCDETAHRDRTTPTKQTSRMIAITNPLTHVYAIMLRTPTQLGLIFTAIFRKAKLITSLSFIDSAKCFRVYNLEELLN